MNRKTALITGASRGIGRAIARYFAEKDYDLVINSIHSKESLLNLKEELEKTYSIKVIAFLGDMGDYEVVKNLFELIEKEFHGLDVIINNAGVSHIGLLTDMTVEEWNHTIQTNLSSVFHCCKLGVPYMVSKKQGKIINISSVWGNTGASCEVAYSAAKGGINSFTKALAKELAPSNIQVNAVACGAIDTQMNYFLSEEEYENLISEIPANRMGQPEEVAALVYTLASGHPYLTGQIISLDGGWVC